MYSTLSESWEDNQLFVMLSICVLLCDVQVHDGVDMSHIQCSVND